MKNLFLSLVLIVLIFFSGCVSQVAPETTDKIISACEQKCLEALNANQDLSKGPCLLNPMPEHPDWVCDVAHSPRQDVDNLVENQCSAYGERKATHFVEVDPTCKFIRAM